MCSSDLFQTRNIVFNTDRRDKLTDVTVGMQWRIDRAWSVRPQLTYIHNASNIEINAYKRYEVSITLRRDFK